jgi:hypothetical protein
MTERKQRPLSRNRVIGGLFTGWRNQDRLPLTDLDGVSPRKGSRFIIGKSTVKFRFFISSALPPDDRRVLSKDRPDTKE